MKQRSILLLDTQPRTQNYYITLAIKDALRRHPTVARVVLASHGDAIRTFRDDNLDTFIAFGGSETHTDVLARLCQLSELSILWTTEDPYQVVGNAKTSTCFDIVFSNDKASVPTYEGRGYHLPLAASPLYQNYPVLRDDSEYIYDLLFIGTAWPNRVKTLNRILGAFGDALKVKLALPWNEFIGPPDIDGIQDLTDWRCGNSDFARFANRSRVVLTLPRHFSASSDQNAIGSTPPPRLFEIALAGGAQIIVSPEPETRLYYDRSEVLLCEDDDQAINAIREMLVSPERRITMAERARERTEREHLYSHRVDELLKVACALASRRPRSLSASHARKVVLFVSHNRLGYQPGGGVEVYQEILAENLRDFDPLFMFPAVKNGRTFLCVKGKGISREIECATMDPQLINDDRVESFFEEVLIEHKVDIVHFHHLLYLPLSLPLIARACGVPIVWQVHDYYLLCERYNLLTFDKRFCDVVNNGVGRCDACLLSLNDRPVGTKARRDGVMALIVNSIDAFIASTPYSGSYLQGFFPEIQTGQINVIELPSAKHPAYPAKIDPEVILNKSHLDVAIPGNFSEIKGGRYLIDLIRLCGDYNIRFHVFGRVVDGFVDQLKSLESDKLIVKNGYEHQEIIGLMAGCDVSIHLSIWPETYMLSLSEAWEAELIPIVSDIGAPSERVSEGLDGFRVPPNDPSVAFDRLQRLYFDRNLLLRMRKAVSEKKFPTVDDHVKLVESLYKNLVAQQPCPQVGVPDLMPRSYGMTLFDVGVRVNSPRWSTGENFWDGQDPSSHHPISKTPRAIFCELSPEEMALPVKVLGLDNALGGLYVDTLKVDNRSAPVITRDVAFEEITLEGWMASGRHDPSKTYVRLRKDNVTLFAALTTRLRDDVAKLLGRASAVRSGFEGSLSVKALASGVYSVDFLQVTPDCMLVKNDVFRFAVQSIEEFPLYYAPMWRGDRVSDLFGEKKVVTGVTGVQITEQNLDEIGGILVGRMHDTWWISVTGLINPEKSVVTIAILEDENGRAVYDAPVHAITQTGAAAASASFLIIGQLADIAVGTYTLKVAHIGQRQVIIQDTGARMFKSPEFGRFTWSKSAPPGFEFGEKSELTTTFHLDKASLSTVSLRDLQLDLVTCEGWGFAKGVGAPGYSFVTWTEGKHRWYCTLEQLPRPDVAEDQRDSRAVNCGFSFSIPSEALHSDNIRFFQRYPSRTVEFKGFDGKLRALLGAVQG